MAGDDDGGDAAPSDAIDPHIYFCSNESPAKSLGKKTNQEEPVDYNLFCSVNSNDSQVDNKPTFGEPILDLIVDRNSKPFFLGSMVDYEEAGQ